MKKTALQLGFSELHREAVYSEEGRARKAKKVLAILQDYLPQLGGLRVLEVGCAAGYCTQVYAEKFDSVIGIDVDEPAVQHAMKHNSRSNVTYYVMDSQRTAFVDGSFDVVICSHVYEHVPDSNVLICEVDRLLKPGGVCFFAAGNRLSFMEPHYRLPLLSVIPKWLAHSYMRAFNRGDHYYENHLTYWGLKNLVSRFNLVDYTIKVVEEPDKFRATEIVPPGSFKQSISLLLLRLVYWLCPTYLWLLVKKRAPRSI